MCRIVWVPDLIGPRLVQHVERKTQKNPPKMHMLEAANDHIPKLYIFYTLKGFWNFHGFPLLKKFSWILRLVNFDKSGKFRKNLIGRMTNLLQEVDPIGNTLAKLFENVSETLEKHWMQTCDISNRYMVYRIPFLPKLYGFIYIYIYVYILYINIRFVFFLSCMSCIYIYTHIIHKYQICFLTGIS